METRCIVFDLDGVLFDNKARKRAYRIQRKDNNELADTRYENGYYFRHDTIIDNAASIVTSCCSDHQVIYLTGRRETSREATTGSLETHGFPDGILYLKPSKNDDTQAYKKRVLKSLQSKYMVIAYYDDDPVNVEIGESLGIPSYVELPGVNNF